MKAITLKSHGGIEQLSYNDLKIHKINMAEVLIKVKAISINPVDVKSRAGKGIYRIIKTQNPLILGWNIAGIVEEIQSDLFKVEDEVLIINT